MAGICFRQITEPSEHVVREPVTNPFSLMQHVVCITDPIYRVLITELSEITYGIRITELFRIELIDTDIRAECL